MTTSCLATNSIIAVYINVLLLHRPDALVEPDEVARAFDDLETWDPRPCDRAVGVTDAVQGGTLLSLRASRTVADTQCSQPGRSNFLECLVGYVFIYVYFRRRLR